MWWTVLLHKVLLTYSSKHVSLLMEPFTTAINIGYYAREECSCRDIEDITERKGMIVIFRVALEASIQGTSYNTDITLKRINKDSPYETFLCANTHSYSWALYHWESPIIHRNKTNALFQIIISDYLVVLIRHAICKSHNSFMETLHCAFIVYISEQCKRCDNNTTQIPVKQCTMCTQLLFPLYTLHIYPPQSY